MIVPLMFPAVVLVFREVSPSAGMGVRGPCPEEVSPGAGMGVGALPCSPVTVLFSLARRAGCQAPSTFLSF